VPGGEDHERLFSNYLDILIGFALVMLAGADRAR
jgi:hypothetical protein